MPASRRLSAALPAALLATALAVAAPATALAAARSDYVPQVGQEGKDVIWVPTPHALVERMLDMAQVTAADYVIDLGSGDGRMVIAAAKRGARALGIEYNPDMVELSRRNAEKEGVGGRARFVRGDIFESDFSEATVLTLYLLPSLNRKLRPTILRMRPGTRVVSHAFNMEDWQPDQTETVEGRTAYLWIVPARVAGTWRWRSGATEHELVLRQHFQEVSGLLRAGGRTYELAEARLRGAELSFTVYEPAGGRTVRRDFSGRVADDRIEGVVREGGAAVKWSAAREREPAAAGAPR